jgi:hypothetical protein
MIVKKIKHLITNVDVEFSDFLVLPVLVIILNKPDPSIPFTFNFPPITTFNWKKRASKNNHNYLGQ